MRVYAVQVLLTCIKKSDFTYKKSKITTAKHIKLTENTGNLEGLMTNSVTIMGRVAMIMMVALLLGACGSSGNNLEKLHGSWNLDQQKTVDLSKEYGKMSKEMKAELLGRMGQPSMKIDVFSKKIALIKGPQDQGLVLPFEVKKDSGDTLIILINQSETKIGGFNLQVQHPQS